MFCTSIGRTLEPHSSRHGAGTMLSKFVLHCRCISHTARAMDMIKSPLKQTTPKQCFRIPSTLQPHQSHSSRHGHEQITVRKNTPKRIHYTARAMDCQNIHLAAHIRKSAMYCQVRRTCDESCHTVVQPCIIVERFSWQNFVLRRVLVVARVLLLGVLLNGRVLGLLPSTFFN